MNRVEIIVVINNIARVVRTLVNNNATDTYQASSNIGRYAVDTNSSIIPDNVYRYPQIQLMPVDINGLPGVGAPGATANFTPLTPYVPIPSRVNPFTGRYSLDLFPDGDTQVPTTYQLSDITDISTVNSSFTKTISLPGSKRNEQAFGFISDLSADSTFNPNKRCRVYVEADSVVVLEGWIQLTKVIKNEQKQLDKLECTIYADSANLWKELGEATLDQINLVELNHDRTSTNIISSWAQTSDKGGYYYPLIDYGGYGTSNHTEYGADGSAFYANGDWALKDIGGEPSATGSYSKVTPEMMYPSVYAKTIWDKIFQNIGFQYKSNFLSSNTFKNLIIPFSRSVLKRAPSWVINKTFTVGLGVVNNGRSATMSYGTQSNRWYLTPAATGTTKEFFGGIVGIGNLSYGTAQNNYISAGVRIRFADTGVYYPYQNSFSSDPGHVFNPLSTSYAPYNKYNMGVLSATANDGWTGRMKIRFGVYYKIWQFGNQFTNGETGNYGEVSVRRTRNINGVTFSSTVGSTSGYAFAGYSTQSYSGSGRSVSGLGNAAFNLYSWKDYTGLIPNVNGTLKPMRFPYAPFENGGVVNTSGIPLNIPGYNDQRVYNSGQYGIEPGSGLAGRLYEGEFYTAWLDGTNVNQYQTWFGEEFYLDYKAGVENYQKGVTVSYVDPKTAMWIEFIPDLGPDETVDMNNVLPSNTKQKDYLMSIIKMFNLVIEPDKQVPNMLNIEPRDDYYSSGSTKDWTSKLDRNEDVEIQILGDIQNKTTIFKYKDDSDYYNADYKSRHQVTYGQYRFELDNDFIEGEKKVEISFSPTPMVNVAGSRGFIIPKIVKASNGVFNKTDSNIRILTKTTSGTVSNTAGEVWLFGSTSSATFSYYPYAGHFDNPYIPGDDINFGQTVDLYYAEQTRATNQNLFTKYYYKQMNEYSDKDSRLLTGMFYLTPKDIYDFRFNDNIIIDNQYFKVVKIDGYDPTQRANCKVTLVKTLDITKPGPITTSINVSNPIRGLITSLGSSRNTIMSQGSGVIGIGNVIAGGSDGTFISGNANMLAGNNPGTLISGNSNTISNNSVNSTISGDSNIISSSSSTNIFGSSNTILSNTFTSVFGNTNFVGANVNAQVIGSNNTLSEAHASVDEVSTIYGYNNVVGTNSTATHILGSYNIVAESGTASNVTHILGNSNNVIPTSSTTNDLSIVHVVGSSNTIYPTITPLNTVFGSRNIIGTSSIGYIVGSDNTIASAVTQSIVIGSNNNISSSSATVFGDGNSVPATTYNSKIFGNNITFSPAVQNTTAIGRNINATDSNKVYISDVVISGGTGSALGLLNTLAVSGDPGNQNITGTVSIVRGSYSGSSLQVAPLFTRLDSGGGYEEVYIQRSTYTGGLTFSVRTGSYYTGTVKSVNLIELDVEAMISSGSGVGEMYWSKTTRVMDNNGALIGVEDQVVKSTLSSGRDIIETFVKTGSFFDIVIYIPGSASSYDFLIKAKRTTLGPAI